MSTRMDTDRGGRRPRGRGVRPPASRDARMTDAAGGSGVPGRRKTDDERNGSGGPRGRSRGGKAALSSGGITKSKKDVKTKPKFDKDRIQQQADSSGSAASAAQRDVTQTLKRGGFDEITVKGLERSSAFSNHDRGLGDLVSFLEKKSKKKIRKSRMEGQAALMSVWPDDTSAFTRCNGFQWAGTTISVEVTSKAGQTSKDGQELKDKFQRMLSKRYDPARRLLDLSAMGQDPEFIGTGMFDVGGDRARKFFLALMTVTDEAFKTLQQKSESVESVTLAKNELSGVKEVISLATTFPELKNLDLSGNKVGKIEDLEPFRRKFRRLEQLYLGDNPIVTGEPNYIETISQWFPSLQVMDGVTVRTPEQVIAALQEQKKLPFPIMPPRFDDSTGVAEKFVRTFFEGFDRDRKAMIDLLYDANSTFSYALNDRHATGGSKFDPSDTWRRFSRNMQKHTSAATRMNRRFRGVEEITKVMNQLPRTRHPGLDSEAEKWCIECNIIPGLPDSSGQAPGGLNGLLLVIHGEFEEINDHQADAKQLRSFDRTFVIGAGSGGGGVKIVNDMLTIRAYSTGGWQAPALADPALAASTVAVEQQLPPGYGTAAAGKTEEQVKKEYLEIEFMRTTRLKLPLAQECLLNCQYQPAEALERFQAVKANIPPDAYF